MRTLDMGYFLGKEDEEQPYTAADGDKRDEGDEKGSGTVVQTIAFATVR